MVAMSEAKNVEKENIHHCIAEVVEEFLNDVKNCPECHVRGASKKGYFMYKLCKKHKRKFKDIFNGW